MQKIFGLTLFIVLSFLAFNACDKSEQTLITDEKVLAQDKDFVQLITTIVKVGQEAYSHSQVGTPRFNEFYQLLQNSHKNQQPISQSELEEGLRLSGFSSLEPLNNLIESGKSTGEKLRQRYSEELLSNPDKVRSAISQVIVEHKLAQKKVTVLRTADCRSLCQDKLYNCQGGATLDFVWNVIEYTAGGAFIGGFLGGIAGAYFGVPGGGITVGSGLGALGGLWLAALTYDNQMTACDIENSQCLAACNE